MHRTHDLVMTQEEQESEKRTGSKSAEEPQAMAGMLDHGVEKH